MHEQKTLDAADVVVGGGEMGSHIRGFDWSKTSLGPIETWPQSLRSALSILLPSKAQISLFWGEDLITLYNDAYRPVFGAKHPSVLGKPIREAWDELWRAGLKEIFDGVLTTGEAFWAQDRPFFLERYGYPEETYFDVSYDPVRDESGRVGGVFCIVSETTGRVVGERRLRALRDLGHIAQHVRMVVDVYAAATDVLSRYAEDLPFALLYMPRDKIGLDLVARVGLPVDSNAAPAHLPASGQSIWPLSNELAVLNDEELAPFGSLNAAPWPEPIRQAVVLPFVASGQTSSSYLIAGISPRRKLDDAYVDFLRLVVGNIAGAIASARKVEDEQNRANMLAKLDRAKTTFFSNVSHELRTPLTLILGPVEELLQQPALDSHARQHLTYVHRSSLRLLKLVNTLLDFSRLEGGRLRARYEPTDLAHLTAELASTFRSAIENAGLTFDVKCERLRADVYVDRDMWEKIVLNLLSNAFKFTLQGGIAIELEETSEGVQLQVRDSGTGIPESEIPRLFERFYRVPNARGRSNEGTGIGLALVNELVRLHGGTIAVSSKERRGSTFTVTLPFGSEHLPMEQVHAPVARSVRSNAAHAFLEEINAWDESRALEQITDLPRSDVSEASAAPAPRARILLADDNADMREYVRHLLGREFEVTTARDGAEALSSIRNQPPDLVLSDVMMPRMDGIALLHALRSDPATVDIPVILLSARAGEEARLEGLNVGADDYLVKPFSARELVARVHAHVRLAQLRRRAQEALQEAEGLRWRAAHEQMRVKLSELQRIFHNAHSFMAVLSGPDLVFELANPAYEKLVDHRQVVGKPLMEALPELIDQPYPELLKRVIETGEPFIGREMPVRLFPKPNEPPVQRFVDVIYMPLVEEGAGNAVLVEGYDVTDRVEAKMQLESANKRKDEFLATLAHELRNPLAALSSAAHLLIRAEQKPAIAAVARDALTRQVDQMARLLDDLLDLARITHGRVHLRKAVIPLDEAIAAAVETSRPLFEAKRHSLDVERPPVPIHVDADRVRLAQIFTNLLANAAKYTDPGGAIALRVRHDNARVLVTVADNGIGLSAETLSRVFEMFSQATPALERSEGGLGIGLALVKGLVELHGGRVSARSAGIGCGSEFCVDLPLAAAHAVETTVDASAAGTRRVSIENRRVLIADDNRDSAQSWAAMLELEGFRTCAAFSGADALRLAEAFKPHVALLDIGMPEMNGYDAARLLRSSPSGANMLLIALTGWGQEQDKQAAREAGFDAHLTKPVNLQHVIDLIQEHAQQPPSD